MVNTTLSGISVRKLRNRLFNQALNTFVVHQLLPRQSIASQNYNLMQTMPTHMRLPISH